MAKDNKNDEFHDLADLNRSSVNEFGDKIMKDLTHGTNPQFTYPVREKRKDPS
jgi:hypothetical protein